MLACFKYDRCWWVLEQEGAVPGMVRVDSISQRLRKPAVSRLYTKSRIWDEQVSLAHLRSMLKVMDGVPSELK